MGDEKETARGSRARPSAGAPENPHELSVPRADSNGSDHDFPVDVDQDGNGVLRDGRMYQLVRQHDAVRDRTLELAFLAPGRSVRVHLRVANRPDREATRRVRSGRRDELNTVAK